MQFLISKSHKYHLAPLKNGQWEIPKSSGNALFSSHLKIEEMKTFLFHIWFEH